jgi:precorrin-2 dehydrogenase/sirohydrochlorin ferrochelatase
MLDVEGKNCLVVGGGGVALRKVEGLLSDGARVKVVAKEPTEALLVFSERSAIDLSQREYRTGEAGNYALVLLPPTIARSTVRFSRTRKRPAAG